MHGSMTAEKMKYRSHEVEDTAYTTLSVARMVHNGMLLRIRVPVLEPYSRTRFCTPQPDSIHRFGHCSVATSATTAAVAINVFVRPSRASLRAGSCREWPCRRVNITGFGGMAGIK